MKIDYIRLMRTAKPGFLTTPTRCSGMSTIQLDSEQGERPNFFVEGTCGCYNQD